MELIDILKEKYLYCFFSIDLINTYSIFFVSNIDSVKTLREIVLALDNAEFSYSCKEFTCHKALGILI